MLLSVPAGTSFLGEGTVARPGLTGCLNCLWLPACATWNQPSCWSLRIISRLFIAARPSAQEYTFRIHSSIFGSASEREPNDCTQRMEKRQSLSRDCRERQY